MITRIEIDGFKSFVDFELDVPPFLALLGTNASGKSNLIDALRAVVGLGGGEAFTSLYTAGRGTPTEMFHQRANDSRVPRAQFRCDVIADAPELGGAIGLEYGAQVALDAKQNAVRVAPVSFYTSRWRSGWQEEFRASGGSQDALDALASTELHLPKAAKPEEALDGRGLTPFALYGAPFESMLNGSQRASWLMARELRSWHFLSLIPAEMRDRSLATDDGPLDVDGRNLASVLGRISGLDVMWDLVSDAVALIPDLRDVVVTRNKEYWEYELIFRGTGRISPGMASDGTLRVLAILAALHDPDHPGVLILDEIENGLHPARLTELLRRIRSRVTDWRLPGGLRSPMRQVIFSTHSPVVLSVLYPDHADDLGFLTTATHPWNEDGERFSSLVTRARSVGEPDPEARGSHVSAGEIRQILELVHPQKPSE